MIDIKSTACNMLYQSSIVDRYARYRNSRSGCYVIILLYHRVAPKENRWSLEPLAPEDFEKQLSFLSKGFEVVSLKWLVEAMNNRTLFSSNGRFAVLTFDDGYQDNYTYAYPLLLRYNMPATIYLSSGLIGRDEMFWWDNVGYVLEHTNVSEVHLEGFGHYAVRDTASRKGVSEDIISKLKGLPDEEKNDVIDRLIKIAKVVIPLKLGGDMVLKWEQVREMHLGGVDFGCHGVTHSILTNTPIMKAKEEVLCSKKQIEDCLGQEVFSFSYPNGDYNSSVRALVERIGFQCAVSAEGRVVKEGENMFSLPRIGTVSNISKFRIITSELFKDFIRR